jgi:hypothetical protein
LGDQGSTASKRQQVALGGPGRRLWLQFGAHCLFTRAANKSVIQKILWFRKSQGSKNHLALVSESHDHVNHGICSHQASPDDGIPDWESGDFPNHAETESQLAWRSRALVIVTNFRRWAESATSTMALPLGNCRRRIHSARPLPVSSGTHPQSPCRRLLLLW